jgi:hypothetical protein
MLAEAAVAKPPMATATAAADAAAMVRLRMGRPFGCG